MPLGAVTKVTRGKTSFILVKVVIPLENGNIILDYKLVRYNKSALPTGPGRAEIAPRGCHESDWG